MRAPLPIFVVFGCLWSVGLNAESISLQSRPAFAWQGQTARSISNRNAQRHAVAGDLGRGFLSSERRDPFRTAVRSKLPEGTFHSTITPPLNFLFYRSSPAPSRGVSTFTNVFSQTLFDRKPKGPRGRRELAQAKAR